MSDFERELSNLSKEFESKIGIIIDSIGSREKAAKIANVSMSQITRWKQGENSPSLFPIALLAEAAGYSLDWLIGKGTSEKDDTVRIPRYKAELSAGNGIWNNSEHLVDHLPFTTDFLKKKLVGSSAKNLVLLDVSGDSMEPTLANDSLIMIDTGNTTITQGGIFAFVYEGHSMVKRLQFQGKKIKVTSDNSELYEPYYIDVSDENFKIIGRAVWTSHSF